MKKVLDFATVYAKACDWKDLSLLKLCLCALGVMIGMKIPEKGKKPALIAALIIFWMTCVPLMVKMIDLIVKNCKAQEEDEDAVPAIEE